jgi:membrane-associated protein
MPHFDLLHWVITLGYVGVVLIVFIETGLFFGFFLPGDSLLFTAGLLASQKIFDIRILVPLIIVAAILGYQVGYWFGQKIIQWLLKRKESFWFKRAYLEQAKDFYDRHGGKALIIGRLIPVVRTFIPVVAGMVHMTNRRYFIYNVSGALMWGGGMTLLGYYLGSIFPQASHYITIIAILIVLLSISPAVWRVSCDYICKKKRKSE